MLRINDEAPNFTAETSQGTINFHEWIGNGWAILFSHPKDFTPVCTTELGYMAGLQPEFKKRNCKIIGLSVDPVSSHGKWVEDIEETQGHKVKYPIIGDPELKVSKLYDMLPAEAGDTSEDRTAATNATVRTVFVVGPDKKIKLMLSYPMSTGRNFDEVLRVLDSIQLTTKHQVSTPVNWKPGDDVIISGSVSDDEAKKKYPGGWKAPLPYLRIVPQPTQDASEALREAQAELARVTRLTAMGELAASIAHELKQPLAGAVANSEACLAWLSSQPPNLDEVRAAADRTIEAATRASDIIHRIQALFKKTAPERTRVNINEVIEETLDLIRSEVLENNVSLQTELGSQLPPVLGDRVQLQQVVLNLVKNGIEAMSGVQDRALQLRIRSGRYEPNQIVIAVEDSGAGIDPQALGKIFEPFYTTKQQGTGMGLAISRSIIEAHGGRLWVESNPSHGAIFQYTLPADVESVQ